MELDTGAEWRAQLAHFRALHRSAYGIADFAEIEPAYHYGWDAGRNDKLRDLSWSHVESALRVDWERRYPDGDWGRLRRAIRLGWERAREMVATDAG